MEENTPGNSAPRSPDNAKKYSLSEENISPEVHHHLYHHSKSHIISHSNNRKNSHSKKYRKNEILQKIELVLSSKILKITGIILVILGIWFAIDPLAIVKSLWHFINNENSGSQSIIGLNQSWNLSKEIIFKLILGFLITSIFYMVSLWRKSIESEIISMAGWFIFGAWWIMTLYNSSNPLLYYGYILASTLFFLLFFIINIYPVSFVNKSLSYKISEGILIMANGAFYFISIYLYILQNRTQVIVFTILLLGFLFLSFYLAEKKNREYSRIPYFIFSALVASALLPLFTGGKDFVIFFSVFSILTILLLGASKNNFYFFLSSGSLVLILLLLILNIVFKFIPYLLNYQGSPDGHLVIKGTVEYIAVLSAFIINPYILRRNHLRISKKLYRKVEILKAMKGGRLLLIYLAGLWIYFYFLYLLFPDAIMRAPIWFSYHCLFFIVTIPRLAGRSSSFVSPVYFTGGILSFLYPVLINSCNTFVRDSYISYGNGWLPEFAFHYLNVLLLILFLSLLLHFSRKGMPWVKNSREIAWFYILSMLIYIFYTEAEHLLALSAHNNGWIISETLSGFRKIPASLLLAGISILIMGLGFLRKEPFLRIFSLILLGLAILKIVISDILESKSLTRIIVYLSLGIILIIISIYYSKLKKIFTKRRKKERMNRHHHS
ncbi:MAG: DUF2339 domain-containing protein [Bacteroidota bacterium]|nr:DUF2339 domain-containing protein [Bacteroidota bacterium]